MAVSAGGPIVRVWDLLGASTSASTSTADAGVDGDEGETEDTGTQYCVKALSNHQKTIMCLCWAEGENGEKRVLSGGLDGLVKVYDPQDNWRVRHTMRYGGQVLTVAVSVCSGSMTSFAVLSAHELLFAAQFLTPHRWPVRWFTVYPNTARCQENRSVEGICRAIIRCYARRRWLSWCHFYRSGSDGRAQRRRSGFCTKWRAQSRTRAQTKIARMGSHAQGFQIRRCARLCHAQGTFSPCSGAAEFSSALADSLSLSLFLPSPRLSRPPLRLPC